MHVLESNTALQRIREGLKRLKLLDHEVVGLYLDISADSVLLLLASISMGLKVALCPTREPPLVLNNWLEMLGAKIVLSSCRKPKGIRARWFCTKDIFDASAKLSEAHLVQCPKAASQQQSSAFISILRTSGTSAQPKSVVINESAYKASAQSVNNYFAVTDKSSFLLSLPLYHVSGLSIIFRSILSGASLYVANGYDELKRGITGYNITHVSLVPTQLKRLLDDNVSLRHLKAVIVGGDALGMGLCNRALTEGVPLYTSYGLTETASMILVRNCALDVVTVLPHARLKRAADGEILVRGQSLLAGYLYEQGRVISPLQNGWFKTGDMMSGVNQLQLIVRKHNRIISGGENIQPEEVEQVLENHPHIERAVVIGLEDENLGMRPLAYIKYISDPLSDQQLADYVKHHLAAYKCPTKFFPWPDDVPDTIKKPRTWFLTKLS